MVVFQKNSMKSGFTQPSPLNTSTGLARGITPDDLTFLSSLSHFNRRAFQPRLLLHHGPLRLGRHPQPEVGHVHARDERRLLQDPRDSPEGRGERDEI